MAEAMEPVMVKKSICFIIVISSLEIKSSGLSKVAVAPLLIFIYNYIFVLIRAFSYLF